MDYSFKWCWLKIILAREVKVQKRKKTFFWSNIDQEMLLAFLASCWYDSNSVWKLPKMSHLNFGAKNDQHYTCPFLAWKFKVNKTFFDWFSNTVTRQQIENCSGSVYLQVFSAREGESCPHLSTLGSTGTGCWIRGTDRQKAMYLSTSPTSNGPQHHHHQCGSSSPRRGSAPPLSFQLLAARKGSNPEFTSTAGSHKEGSSGFSILGFGRRKSSNASSNGHTP